MENQTELSKVELSQESNADTLDTQEALNSEPEIAEEMRIPEPWESAPEGLVYYEKIYEDGHLGSFTKSAELAYKFRWFNNSIPESDLKVSDINGWTYRKELCPMKTEEDHLKDQYRIEIQQLKKQLSDTDYKAIKYAEGQISEEEYSEIKSERQRYRDRINYLEGML